MQERFLDHLHSELETLKSEGLYKSERVIKSQQQASVQVQDKTVINLCANNYLGLANNPALIHKGQEALQKYGYGMASVRFICGTQTPHKTLESKISQFLSKEDTILYSSCFDANTGLFETLLGPEDAIISDALNHASIIDGVRLCKAARFRYANNDMRDLEAQLIAAKDARFRLIATDGVFSMDGVIANLPAICELADKYDAMVMVDDSHAVGFMGETGRGTPQYCGVTDRVDIITGTLGKALGGASGGYTASHSLIIDWLRQRSRPYLFSNTLAPVIAETSIAVLNLLEESNELLVKLRRNSNYFRQGMTELGFDLIPGEHPIIPVMLGDASLAAKMADLLLKEGIYVVGFSYPVVPKGKARIRTQMSAAHELEHLDQALKAFSKVGKLLNII
ncbi:glycine C-acetyltransferase [Legionella sp. D16C41]|uniref:glycine C-acetyltransferase n=1 Tax=Legionella sp. D16C41 TaxID=3402688 RepID=UPI003AF748F2